MLRFLSVLLVSVSLVASSSAVAHEFWIEPQMARVPENGTIVADLRVGQNFSGTSFPYLSHRFVRFWFRDGGVDRPVAGNEGDIPAIRIERVAPGVTAIAYHSTADRLVFDTWAEFVEYVEYEGNGWAAAAHRKSGRSEAGISERYIRCAKALVRVGNAPEWPGDPGIGLPLELVALTDPFDVKRGSLRVRLVWMGAPIADVQVAVFSGAPLVSRTLVRTGPDGEAEIPLLPGQRYLLSAVRMAQLPVGDEVDWESHWASLTFETGQR